MAQRDLGGHDIGKEAYPEQSSHLTPGLPVTARLVPSSLVYKLMELVEIYLSAAESWVPLAFFAHCLQELKVFRIPGLVLGCRRYLVLQLIDGLDASIKGEILGVHHKWWLP